ncbi:MAG: hypothetical protein DRN20_05585 [Thermoplasmata archaeon]|nr:MAG: hypothetical protein DRN20_05585 [Thermoplasmata archaeon]
MKYYYQVEDDGTHYPLRAGTVESAWKEVEQALAKSHYTVGDSDTECTQWDVIELSAKEYTDVSRGLETIFIVEGERRGNPPIVLYACLYEEGKDEPIETHYYGLYPVNE